MLKVGLVGCGGMGAMHAECWLSGELDAQLVAIADVNTERAGKYAERSGAKVYTDAKAMMDQEELDVVDICLPTFLHAEFTLYAMERVPNVIVEKPLCLNEKEVQQLLDAEKRTGSFVQVAHVVRFGNSGRYIKEAVASGKYGKVIAGYFSRISPRPMWMAGHDDVNKSGGVALDLHIHDVDYIRYLMGGDPDKISSRGVKDAEGRVQHIWSSYDFGGTIIVAASSWDYPTNMPFAAQSRIRLEKAAFVVDSSGLTVYPDGEEAFKPEFPPARIADVGINVSDMTAYLIELNYMVDNIKSGKKESIITLSEAAAACRLVWKEIELLNK